MSSMSLEQSKHELVLDAAKQRLNKANKQVIIDTNNVASAKLMMDNAIAMFASAKSQLDMSKKEAEEAEAMLISNIDQKPAAAKPSEGSSNKQKKKEEDSDHAYEDETDKEDDGSVSHQANDQKQSTDSPRDNSRKRRKVSVSPDSVKSEELDDNDCARKKAKRELKKRNRSVQKTDHIECSVEGCSRKAADNGKCKREHGGRNHCSQDGCTNALVKGGVCIKHGAKKIRKICSYDGCTNNARGKDGVCIRHGAVVKKRKKCSNDECTNQSKKRGLCTKHYNQIGNNQSNEETCTVVPV
jgi:hypothetical protein